MPTLTYQPEELGSLLVLLVHVAKDSSGDWYDNHDDQLKDFVKQRAQDGADSDFLRNVRKIVTLRNDAANGDLAAKNLSDLLDKAHVAITILMGALVTSERWSVCGTINREHIFTMGALLPSGSNLKTTAAEAILTKGEVPTGGRYK